MSTHGTITDHIFQFQIERKKPWEDQIPAKKDPWCYELRVEIGGFELQIEVRRNRNIIKRLRKPRRFSWYAKNGYLVTFNPLFMIEASVQTGPWFHRDSGDYDRDRRGGKFPH